MAEDMPGDPGADGRFVRLVNGDMHLVEDGRPGTPALLLIHGSAGSTAWWDPVVPALAGARRVIRVDLLGHGRSSSPARGYDIPAHAGRVGAALDRLGVGRVPVIGHSMGCMVATALAEQRPDMVAGLALIDMGPSLDAASPDGLLVRLLLTQFPGRLLWRLRSEATRARMSSSLSRCRCRCRRWSGTRSAAQRRRGRVRPGTVIPAYHPDLVIDRSPRQGAGSQPAPGRTRAATRRMGGKVPVPGQPGPTRFADEAGKIESNSVALGHRKRSFGTCERTTERGEHRRGRSPAGNRMAGSHKDR